MRILVVTYEFPPIGGGGGHAAREICRGLARRGHDVHVLTAHWKGLPHQETRDGVHIRRFSSGRTSPYQAGFLTMSGFVVAGLAGGASYVRSWRPDLIHVHFAVPSGPVAWGLSRLTGKPYVLTAHLGDVPGGVPEKTGRWFRWIYPLTPPIWRDAARVVAVSEFTRQLALQHYPLDIQVIPNGIDRCHLPLGEIKPGKPPLIVFAGRFMVQKNPLLFVRTLARLKDLDWRCVMMGDGPLRLDIEREIKDQGLDERFTLPGWVTPEEVVECFSKADILFMPSRSEGLPVVGVKALALGLAIVASRVGGFLDLVEDGVNGYLIESPEDLEGFASALRELISSGERLGDFRRASCQKAQEFDAEHVVTAYEGLFMDVLGQRATIK
jgi:glycosyltransferase involved in cell wall biosynthesis